ncbi:autophagy-related protein 16-1 isoform X1 [Vespula squamosa]|uniref:Autophagy-related protein 16-1 isoform X1 n=1 Tax=Vespula squamosa TaxID=30214 RepID=A0ABD2A9I2_VESSQ
MCSVWYLSLSLLEFHKTELNKIESTGIFKEKWQLTNWNSHVSPEMTIIGGKILSHSFATETGLKHNRLFENVNTLRGQNMQLTISNENLRREAGNRSPGISPSISSTHEARLLKQTEELTALHRKNGEHMLQIVDLNKKIQEMIEELHAKDASLTESMETNTALHLEITKYVNREREYESINQMLKDEHQALQLAFASLEDKLRKSQEENRQLVERLIKYKARDAEKMNEENDNFLKKRQAKMQKELEDAARDTRPVSPDRSSLKEGVAGLPTTVPTKVSVTFNAHEGEVYAVKWSPVDRILATGGADRKVKLWSIIKGTSESKGVLVGSNAGVMSVDFDSTGTLILGASNDFASRVWTVSDLRVKVRKMKEPPRYDFSGSHLHAANAFLVPTPPRLIHFTVHVGGGRSYIKTSNERRARRPQPLSVRLRSSVTFVFLWRVNVLAMGQDND